MIRQLANTLVELRKIKKKLNHNKHRANVTGVSSQKQTGRDIELKRIHTYGFTCESLTFGNSESKFLKKSEGRIHPSVWNDRYPDIYQEILNLALLY